MRLRVAFACLAAACVLIALAGSASGAGGVPQCPGTAVALGVNVYVNGQLAAGCDKTFFSNDANLPGPYPYQVGAGTQNVTNAISIRRLLKMAGLKPANVSLVWLRRADGTPSVLDKIELLDPSGQFSGTPPAPLVWINGARTEYLRQPPTHGNTRFNPVISTDAISRPGALDLHVFTGQRLVVSVVPATGTVQPGQPTKFSAFPTGEASYIWHFSDGATTRTSTATVSHKFSQRGTGTAYVEVKGADGSFGVGGAPVTVQGIPYNPPVKTTTTSTTSTTTPTTTTPTTTPTYTYTNPTTTTTPHKHTGPRIGNNTPGLRGGKIVEGRLISAVTPVSAAQIARTNIPPPAPVTQRSTQTSVLPSATVKPLAALLAALAIVLLLSSGAGQELRSLRRSIASARLG